MTSNIALVNEKPETLQRTSLDGVWELLPTTSFRGNYYSDEKWLSMNVPSHWQQHPELEFYAGKVAYRKRFRFRKQKGKRYRLRFNGVFYFYIAYLNGFRLGENEGYFFPREFDITAHLKDQDVENELLVEVDCPDEPTKNAKHLITGVFSHWDCLDPKTNPGGIWQPVEIVESGPQYISELRLRPVRREDVVRLADVNPPDRIELRADIVVNSSVPSAPVYRLTFTPYNFEGKPYSIAWRANCAPGDNYVERFFMLENPRLWWTHDLAEPNLYSVKVETFADEMLRTRLDVWEFRWGLRWFELVDWIPYLNGHRMFLKGNNYPPGDTRIACMTRERYLQDFLLARDAHMNFMRIHAHVEKPELYDVADELGILLWQDFPMQWSYAHDVLPQAEGQVPYLIRMVYNHPSVGIWCMHNEPFHITDTKETGFGPVFNNIWSAFVYSWDREVMDARLKKVAEHWDPTRPVLRCSGKWPVPWRKDTDSHLYFGWYSPPEGPRRRLETLSRLYPPALRFVTEFGVQSFPNRESALKFMDGDLSKVDWNHLVERHHFQPNIMSVWYDWRKAKSLDDLIAMSQDYQIEINQYYIDRLRLRKYNPCGGFAAFMFLDSNPAVQWSIIDYWREPKQSYAHMQVALNPEYVFVLLSKDVYHTGESIDAPLYAVNDSLWDYPDVSVRAELLAPAERSVWQSETMRTTLEPDCAAKLVQRLSFKPTQPGDHRLVLTMHYGERSIENHYRVRVV